MVTLHPEGYRLLEEDSLSQSQDAMLASTKNVPLWCRPISVMALIATLVISLNLTLITFISYLQKENVQVSTVRQTSPFGAYI